MTLNEKILQVIDQQIIYIDKRIEASSNNTEKVIETIAKRYLNDTKTMIKQVIAEHKEAEI